MSLDIDDTIRTVLNDGLAGQLDYYTEYLDVARFPEPDYQPAVRDFFRRKYASQTFDVVVAPTDAMVDFVNAVSRRVVSGRSGRVRLSSPEQPVDSATGPRTTGVVFPLNLKSTIDIAIQLQPDLRHVFVVSGVSDTDRVLPGSGAGAIPRPSTAGLASPTRPDWRCQTCSDGWPTLPQHTIVYFLSFFDDGHGSKFDELKALDQVAAVANVPTYVWIDTREGHGSVGGSVFSVERAAGAVANVALRVLKGESPESIPVREIDAQHHPIRLAAAPALGHQRDSTPGG